MSESAGGGRARATRTAQNRARGADAGMPPGAGEEVTLLGNLASSFGRPRPLAALGALAAYAIARRVAPSLLVTVAAAIAWELVTSVWPELLPVARP